MSKYWQNRINSLTDKTIEEIEEELAIIYKRSFDNICNAMKELLEFINTNDNVTISDLYAYNRYYTMIGKIQKELKKLGQKEERILDEYLVEYAEDVQKLIDNDIDFSGVVDEEAAEFIVKNVWAKDGKNYSDRIWEDKSKLIPQLTQGLVDIVASGGSIHQTVKKVEDALTLKSAQSYYIAKRLVRTEISYIQNQMAIDRYKKAGISKYSFHTLRDDKVCEKCKAIDNKEFDLDKAEIGTNQPPIHPLAAAMLVL